MQVGVGGGGGDAGDTRGRHRIQAEFKKLEQEARFLEEELEELEKTDKVSAALLEFLVTIESKADPLLPVAELLALLANLGIGGLKVRKICVDANAGFCDPWQETQRNTKETKGNGCCEVYSVLSPRHEGYSFKATRGFLSWIGCCEVSSV